jgi:hypothetical protein
MSVVVGGPLAHAVSGEPRAALDAHLGIEDRRIDRTAFFLYHKGLL